MASKATYKITLTNWHKYNSKKRRGQLCTFIANNFCTDAKLQTLPITTRWLFLNLVLTCGEHAGDTVEISSRRLREMLECNRNIDRELESLQQLQILTFVKTDSLIIELNRIKENRIKSKGKRAEKPAPPTAPPQNTSPQKVPNSKTPKFIAGYLDRFSERYGVRLRVDKKFAGIAKRIVEWIAEDKLDLYLDAFFNMPDAELVKRKHELVLFEFKKNEIVIFAERQMFTTKNQAFEADKNASNILLLKEIREGKL